ncbi:MAG TPA: hypothetical protein VGR89_10640 [Puia sp.]|nr:hypothetical protein [Puia sp.]
MKTVLTPALVVLSLFGYSCHSAADSERQPGKDTMLVDVSHPELPAPRRNPEFRKQVRTEPVGQYKEKTGNISGDFSVRLFETAKTMDYRAEVEWEGLPGSDTIKVPDLGIEPRPVLQKGPEKFSCIIGFLDNEKQFRELKLVQGRGNDLKITTLRHWVVTNHYRLVSE